MSNSFLSLIKTNPTRVNDIDTSSHMPNWFMLPLPIIHTRDSKIFPKNLQIGVRPCKNNFRTKSFRSTHEVC